MNKTYLFKFALLALLGLQAPAMAVAAESNATAEAAQQARKITGTVIDESGEPVIGASVLVKGKGTGSVTDLNGKFTVEASTGAVLQISFVGYTTQEIKVTSASTYKVTLKDDSQALNEVVVTAMGIKKERKALGYAVSDIKAEELMRNKSNNVVNSLAGKIAGVTVTQAGGAAGGGSEIQLRGGTSLERDNQPLFVIDGVIYDNSTTVPGNSAFDGTLSASSTNANRAMDINPEDIENMSVLKGPAAAALYGSRASAGAIIITTKKGKEGAVEVNFSTKLTTSSVWKLPEIQTTYKRGYCQDVYDAAGNYTRTDYDNRSYNSWGEKAGANETIYDNIGNFFKTGTATDTNLSVAGGNQNGNFYLSTSYYNQSGIIPTTGYDKTTIRFNGEQRWKMLTFNANIAYSNSKTNKTLTSAGLYGDSGSGTMQGVFTWSPFDDMSHYANEDGSRYRMPDVSDALEPWEEKTNPYWTINRNKIKDKTERLTGSVSLKADITKWWWVSYKIGLDEHITNNFKKIASGGTNQKNWQNGMYSENDYRYTYFSNNLMTNFSHSIGQFNGNLLLGYTSEDTKGVSDYRMAWNLIVPDFYSFDNSNDTDRNFSNNKSQHRLQGLYGELRVDWNNTAYFTYSARNDWSSTLPVQNRSYFYQSFSGSVIVSELLPKNDILSFLKLRGSWARVGKDAAPYKTNTSLWPVGTFIGDKTGMGNYWMAANPYLKPEITESTELGLEVNFFRNRLKFDFAYYTNNSFNQIMSPRLSNFVGYILRDVNAGDVRNKGWELTISGTPVSTRDFEWESNLNFSRNKGTVENLMKGVDILYVTDAQIGGNLKAASFNNGSFMGISGSQWSRTEDGKVILDENGMPTYDGVTTHEVGNREAKLKGGWNNTFTYKNVSLNMLWDFSFGGDVVNGTQYGLTVAGLSKLSENRESITIEGVVKDGDNYIDKTFTYERGKTYMYNKKMTSGDAIIANYYQTYYGRESRNFITKVNYLRLRSLNISWNLPKKWLTSTKVIKSATLTAAANNLLLFTNYDGDPEVSYAGSGSIGSSSVGIDYYCVPSTRSFTFGFNLKF
ncbi:MAG: SusC/RagA family TonB-linked outer membrane protein [Bacteroidales bacterium]|nr:SusC/RagA family TonB-linked outer membrane protein [Bacteroidales bacterium]